MITKNNIIALLGTALCLHGGVPETPPINAPTNVAYIGSSIPFQSPRTLVFQLKVNDSTLEISLPLTPENNVKYTARYGDKELSTSPRSPDSVWLLNQLSQIPKDELFDSEAHDLRLTSELIKQGSGIKTENLKSLHDPLANWARTERAGKNLLYRVYQTEENEWQCVGNPYSWGIRLHGEGEVFLFITGIDKDFPVNKNAPLPEIIKKSLLRFERELESRPDYIFGDQSIKLFGPISKEDTLANIQKIRRTLQSSPPSPATTDQGHMSAP